ncbi:MAG: hypothetical protein ACP5NI_02215, partial [Acetobacteraceae bacterium]
MAQPHPSSPAERLAFFLQFLCRAVAAQADPLYAQRVAAAGFAATLPLLLAYPGPLRARLLPLAAETMVRGGQQAAAAALIA